MDSEQIAVGIPSEFKLVLVFPRNNEIYFDIILSMIKIYDADCSQRIFHKIQFASYCYSAWASELTFVLLPMKIPSYFPQTNE